MGNVAHLVSVPACSLDNHTIKGVFMKLTIKQKMLAAAGLALSSSAVMADVTLAESAIASVGTDATALIAAAWPVLTTITVGFIIMKLFKRAASKAS
jgi:hypothetical protein